MLICYLLSEIVLLGDIYVHLLVVLVKDYPFSAENWGHWKRFGKLSYCSRTIIVMEHINDTFSSSM